MQLSGKRLNRFLNDHLSDLDTDDDLSDSELFQIVEFENKPGLC